MLSQLAIGIIVIVTTVAIIGLIYLAYQWYRPMRFDQMDYHIFGEVLL